MDSQNVVHVLPVDDLVEHDSSGAPCACGATREIFIGFDGVQGAMVTHFSLDGRELFECGLPIPQEPGLLRARHDPGE